MQAIISKYLPETDTFSLRIKASCLCASVIVTYPPHLTVTEQHVFAVDQLVKKINEANTATYKTDQSASFWSGPRAVGQLPCGDYAHVFI
jgi:hypothetical protein